MSTIDQLTDIVGTEERLIHVAGLVIGFLALMTVPSLFSYPHVYTITWMLILGILVLGYNVLLGYTGLLSFGHGAFYGGGAYTVAMLMEYTELKSMLLLLAAAVLFNLLLAAAIGVLSLRNDEVYYALLTLALAQIMYVLVVQKYDITSGTDGLRIEQPEFFMIAFEELNTVTFLTEFYYYVVAVTFLLTVVGLWRILQSPFGLTLKTLRENPTRARATGISVNRYRWYSTLLSGMVSGLAGGLFAFLGGHITPNLLNWLFSGEIVFMAIFGGINTFFGPVVGAATYLVLRKWALAQYPQYWQFILGTVLFFTVLTFRDDGVWGTLRRIVEYARRRQDNE